MSRQTYRSTVMEWKGENKNKKSTISTIMRFGGNISISTKLGLALHSNQESNNFGSWYEDTN